uniref:G protein-coupled receptor n=1 Tax=Ditylenchus dipsaci TaxID=166011 RepID=A0A915DTL7_9BILA
MSSSGSNISFNLEVTPHSTGLTYQLVAIVAFAVVSQLVILAHLLAHLAARIGIYKTLTTLTLSVCALNIVAIESTIMCWVDQPHRQDYLGVFVSNVLLSYHPASFSFGYECVHKPDDPNNMLPNSFYLLCWTPPLLYAIAFLLVAFKKSCYRSGRADTRESVAVSTISAVPEVAELRRDHNNRPRVFAQTKLCAVLFLLFVDSIVQFMLQTSIDQAMSATQSVVLTCLHYTLLGLGIPLCHFIANPRLRQSLGQLLGLMLRAPAQLVCGNKEK